jgi:hypothetical protein
MQTNTKYVIPISAISRRTFLASGTAVGAGLLSGRTTRAERVRGVDGPLLKEYDVPTNNGISLHVTEQGEGPAVLFCHGFPDTSYTWRRQMTAISSAGYRAIAPDMRGYGRSSAPADAALYTPLHTAGDLVGLLDALGPDADQNGLTLQSPFLGFCIGHRVLLQPTSGGALWILREAFIVRLPGRCPHGWNQIMSLITSLNSSVPASTVA